MFTNIKLTTMICLAWLIAAPSLTSADTLAEVKQRGYLRCGVSQSLIGFSYRNQGVWAGLDVDICRAIAAAIFGNGEMVEFTPLSTKARFPSLQNKQVDILSRNTTWTYSRDTTLGITFTNVTYYDGQGFMVPKKLGITNLAGLKDRTLCTRAGTTSEANIIEYFTSNNIPYKLLTFEQSDREILAAYHSGSCEVYSGDRASLAAQREKLRDPSEHIILDETISKEPLGPAVRNDDQHWFDIVRWIIYGLITAEEYGITKDNVKLSANSPDPKIKHFLGLVGNIGEPLQLDNRYMYNAIAAVGNYGEIFARNVGPDTKLGIQRGANNLWSAGGLMYAPPFK